MFLRLVREKRIGLAALISRLKEHNKSLTDLAGDGILRTISEF